MADVATPVDVAVLDEIQMIGDEQRGWAWTRALLGIPADVVHACGDESAVSVVEQLCLESGDELEVNRCEQSTAAVTHLVVVFCCFGEDMGCTMCRCRWMSGEGGGGGGGGGLH